MTLGTLIDEAWVFSRERRSESRLIRQRPAAARRCKGESGRQASRSWSSYGPKPGVAKRPANLSMFVTFCGYMY